MLGVLICLGLAATGQDNPVLRQLCEVGWSDGRAEAVRLPPPSLPDGLDAAAQQQVLAEIAGPHRAVADLLRPAVVAPQVLKIEPAAGEGPEPLWRVDLWYVAYGRLEAFWDAAFVDRLFDLASAPGRPGPPRADRLLDEAALQARGVTLTDAACLAERYHASTGPLVDRVLLSSTRRITATRSNEAVVVAAIIDPRFTGDEQFPNRWSAIRWDPQGRFSLGSPQPYTQAGMYLKATRLREPPGALLVEHHQLFAEPQAWFEGKNLLRSKLPLAIQDSVRKLRRELAADRNTAAP